MKLFVVMDWGDCDTYGPGEVQGIFTTKEKALDAVKHWDVARDYEIYETELDVLRELRGGEFISGRIAGAVT